MKTNGTCPQAEAPARARPTLPVIVILECDPAHFDANIKEIAAMSGTPRVLAIEEAPAKH